MAVSQERKENGASQAETDGKLSTTIGAMKGFSRDEWAILERRARELSRPPAVDAAKGDDLVEALTFRLGRETYALPVKYVREVRPLEQLTPMPCTPEFVGGVMNLRGNILSLVDLRKFLNVEQEGISDLMSVIVVEAAGLEVGIMTNRVDEVILLPLADLKPASSAVSGIGAEYIKGITAQALVLLDLEAILTDERMIIEEDIV